MIIYGTRGKHAVLGEAGVHKCPACGEESMFHAIVAYAYFHIWYILSLVYKREYFIVCDNCQATTPVDAAATKAQFPKDNIPFLRKWGLVLCGLALVFFFFSGMVASYGNERALAAATVEFMAQPKVGDVYIADLARVPESGFDPDSSEGGHAYGQMRILEIDGDTLTFATSSIGYNKLSDLRKVLRKPPSNYRYVPEDPLDLTLAEVKELHSKEVIREITRP